MREIERCAGNAPSVASNGPCLFLRPANLMWENSPVTELMGSIDEVDDGIVYGRFYQGEDDIHFWIPLRLVLEDQRVDLEPGRYVSLVNGHLLIHKAIWTTHEIEQADAEATELWRRLGIVPVSPAKRDDER
jgi:hypothetical protein